MAKPKVLGIVLAGGEGKRLMPLTLDRAKPAVPFGGSYRLIDFALSNLVNAGLPAAVRADAVQVALARPAHLADVADVDAARQLRDAGAGAAAARQAVVPRQRRRDLPVDEPDRRRAARHHRGVRRRPRVPDGRLADGARRTSSPAPAASVAGIRVPRKEADQFGVIKTAADGVQIGEFLEKPADPPGSDRQPRRVVRVDGQLRLHRRRAGRGARAATPPTTTPGTTWAATSSRASSTANEAARLRLQAQRRTGLDSPTTATTGAMSGRWRRTTRRTSTWSPSSRRSTSTTATGRSSPRTRSCRARSSSRRPRPTTRSCAAGSIVSGATDPAVGARPQRLRRHRRARRAQRASWTTSRSGRARGCVNAIIDKNVVIPDGVEIGVDHEADRAAGFTVTDEGITVLGKGQPVPGDYTGPG